MDDVREQLNRPLVAGIVGFIIGLIIGLPILGWWLWPVSWTDAAAEHLRDDLKEQWLRMAIDSYVLHSDPAEAAERFEALGEDADEILAGIVADPAPQAPEAVTAFQTAVSGGVVAPPLAGTEVAATPLAGTEAEEPAGGSLLRTLLTAMCVITILLLAAVVVVILLRNRSREAGPVRGATGMQTAQTEWPDYEATGEEAPMAQYMATYKLGDDLFDDSFSIDSPGGEFLGECGVGISETIGVGDPKKVTAFEVWLFDKNDIQTVTKVLMSEHAYEDEAARQRLAAKGEPILANPGGEVVLETQTLQLVARVVDMSYGDGALPENSYFDNLVLQLAVWQK